MKLIVHIEFIDINLIRIKAKAQYHLFTKLNSYVIVFILILNTSYSI